MAGIVGEAGDGGAQSPVAGPSACDNSAFAGGVSNGTDAGLGGELLLGRKTFPDRAEFGDNLGGADAACARERHDDLAVGVVGDGVLDARGELGDLWDEALEDGDEGADELAPSGGFATGCFADGSPRGDGIRFGLASQAGWCGTQLGQQFRGRASSALGVLSQEACQALFAQAHGDVGGGIASEECERDRACDVGEDDGSTWPEAVEQRTELVAQCHTLGDEVVTAANRGAQCLDVVGGGQQRPEPMSIGPQDVGEHVGIAGVPLAAGGPVTGPAGFDHVGMDRHDRMPGLDESIDDQPGRSLDGDRQLCRGSDAPEARDSSRNPAASWLTSRRVMTWPASSTMQTAWATAPQSSPP
ncbi:MAG: hypothetical protein U1E45_16790 [Geminicoccaceae bacterium]